MSAVSTIEGIRDAIVTQLRYFPDFAALTSFTADNPPQVALDEQGIPKSSIVSRQKGDLASAMQEAIARCGVAVVVMITDFTDDDSQSIQAFFKNIEIVILVSENVVQNQDTDHGGSGLGAMFLCERIVAALKLFVPVLSGAGYPLLPKQPTSSDVSTPPDIDAGYYHRAVYFTTMASTAQRAAA